MLHRNTDGDATYVFKNAELQSADDVKWLEGGGEGDVLTRFTFDLSQIAQGVAAWDASMAGKSQMYADLDSMRGLQLAVWFSECERAEYQGQETICWRHTGYKSAWLAQDDDPAMPSAYSHEKVNNTEVIFHPNFCLNGPLDDAWYSVEIVELMCFGACSIKTALANQTKKVCTMQVSGCKRSTLASQHDSGHPAARPFASHPCCWVNSDGCHCSNRGTICSAR